MTFAAVVVSYNRIELLKRCLQALENQERPLDEIIVVDNGSTDGSADYVAEAHPEIVLFRTGGNLGGAGGFAWGVEIAIARGHQAAWLMDDDAEPEPGAAGPLMDQFTEYADKPAFVASLVVSHTGEPTRVNVPAVDPDPHRQLAASRRGGFAIETSTFVGTMVNLDAARRTYLPIADYFIWMDDAEYTHRLTEAGLGIAIPRSRIAHPEKDGGRVDMGSRLFYFVRNNIWRIRARRTDSFVRKAFEIVGVAVVGVRQLPVAADRSVWLRSMARGFREGLFRGPRRQRPGSLLSTLNANERAEISTR